MSPETVSLETLKSTTHQKLLKGRTLLLEYPFEGYLRKVAGKLVNLPETELFLREMMRGSDSRIRVPDFKNHHQGSSAM